MRGEGTEGGKVFIICDALFSQFISITGHTDQTLLVQHVLKVKPVEDVAVFNLNSYSTCSDSK